MEARHSVEFTGVELADGAELAAPVEKATIGPVEKASRRLVSAVESEKDRRRSSGAAEREDGGRSSVVEHVAVARSRCSTL
jgi:hypothetical protein